MQRFKQTKILTGESFILPFTHAGNDITESQKFSFQHPTMN